jgi:hypothetical protein
MVGCCFPYSTAQSFIYECALHDLGLAIIPIILDFRTLCVFLFRACLSDRLLA